MSEVEYLDLAEYLYIAEAVTGIDAHVLHKLPRIYLADSALHAPAASFGGVEFYPDFAEKAAVLCSHLIANHRLPDGNKRAAFVAMRTFIKKNGYTWVHPSVDEAEFMLSTCAEFFDDEYLHSTFAGWVRFHIAEYGSDSKE